MLLELNSRCYDLVQARLAIYQGVKLVRDVKTSRIGQFRVNLRPGTYSIRRSSRDSSAGLIHNGENILVRRGVFTLRQLTVAP
jgi:hypothetical protein